MTPRTNDDLRHECECHFLDLRQRLEERHDQAHDHRRDDGGAGRGHHGPNRSLDDLECVGLDHQLIVTPLPSARVEPF